MGEKGIRLPRSGDRRPPSGGPGPDARMTACLLVMALVACGGAGTEHEGGPSPSDAIPVTGDPIAIGEWTDTPGTCPPGAPRVDIGTVSELEAASRGTGTRAGDPPGTCYLIRNGMFRQQGSSLPLYIRRGGTEAAPRVFVGETRTGVVVVGRATVDDGVSHVVLRNLTLSLVGYSQAGSFNTLTLGNGSDVTVENVTLTGDCATGSRGGHIEVNGTQGLRIEACIVEKFGACNGDGRLDHGIYLASGSNIVVRNNVIRYNSSRGIQLYTAAGEYGTLADVKIERNRIYENGHRDYEDGIVINGAGSGPISRLTIERNLIYRNYYSGIRFSGPATSDISVLRNTFSQNGVASRREGRSEVNVDDAGQAAGSLLQRNIFDVGHALINDCYDGAVQGFAIRENLVHGALSTGGSVDCVSSTLQADPQFFDAAAGDLRTRNPQAATYGAYAQ
jgi:parallel beta-helix repeat protein